MSGKVVQKTTSSSVVVVVVVTVVVYFCVIVFVVAVAGVVVAAGGMAKWCFLFRKISQEGIYAFLWRWWLCLLKLLW